MARTIDVAVARGTNFLRWARNRPARLLPNGCVGAIYNKVAMPVYEDRFDSLSIDIDDDGHDPDECPFWKSSEPFRFSDTASEQCSGADIDWYLETNAYGHYVVFDGDDHTLNDVLGRLAAERVGVKRHGSSHRPADNGRHYDWFIRLEFDGSREDAENFVFDALSKTHSASAPADLGDPAGALNLPVFFLPFNLMLEAIREGMHQRDVRAVVRWLGELIETARLDIDHVKLQLQEEIDEATNSTNEIRKENAQIKRVGALEKLKSETLIKQLNSEIQGLRSRLEHSAADSSNTAELEAEIKKLKTQVAEIDKVYEAWDESENKKDRLESDLLAARKELQSLSAENHRLVNRGPTKVQPSDKMLSLARAALKEFAEIDIHGDAADTIIESFLKFTPLFDVLRRLNNGESVPSTRIKTAGDWFEVNKHVNTGQSDMGRVYFKKQGSGKLFVVVHCKKDNAEQKRFFGKLRDPSFTRNLSFDQR